MSNSKYFLILSFYYKPFLKNNFFKLKGIFSIYAYYPDFCNLEIGFPAFEMALVTFQECRNQFQGCKNSEFAIIKNYNTFLISNLALITLIP